MRECLETQFATDKVTSSTCWRKTPPIWRPSPACRRWVKVCLSFNFDQCCKYRERIGGGVSHEQPDTWNSWTLSHWGKFPHGSLSSCRKVGRNNPKLSISQSTNQSINQSSVFVMSVILKKTVAVFQSAEHTLPKWKQMTCNQVHVHVHVRVRARTPTHEQIGP